MDVKHVELTRNGSAALFQVKQYAKEVLEEVFTPYVFSDGEVEDFLAFADEEYLEFSFRMPEEQSGFSHMKEAGIVNLS